MAAFSASIVVVLLGPVLAMFIKLDDEPAVSVAPPTTGKRAVA
jgi:hypothetical protein